MWLINVLNAVRRILSPSGGMIDLGPSTSVAHHATADGTEGLVDLKSFTFTPPTSTNVSLDRTLKITTAEDGDHLMQGIIGLCAAYPEKEPLLKNACMMMAYVKVNCAQLGAEFGDIEADDLYTIQLITSNACLAAISVAMEKQRARAASDTLDEIVKSWKEDNHD